jgi:hypothetical protein
VSTIDAVCHEHHPSGFACACRARRGYARLCAASPVLPTVPDGEHACTATSTVGAVRPLVPGTTATTGAPVRATRVAGCAADGPGAPGSAAQPPSRQLGREPLLSKGKHRCAPIVKSPTYKERTKGVGGLSASVPFPLVEAEQFNHVESSNVGRG